MFSQTEAAHRLENRLPARHRWVSRPWLAGSAQLAEPFLMLGSSKAPSPRRRKQLLCHKVIGEEWHAIASDSRFVSSLIS